MDLPTCPHCGQSVLDDDVEDCPFCGESLSGKPSKKPKPAASGSGDKPAVSSEKKPAAAPAKAKAAEKPKPKEESLIEAERTKKYIRLRPQPKQGRTWKVVCPMCETAGFTSPQAAQRPVRCCNPDCLVPIFDAPEHIEEKPAEEPVERAVSLGVMAAVGVLVCALVGLGVWWFLGQAARKAAQEQAGQPALTDAELKRQREEREQRQAERDQQAGKNDPAKPPVKVVEATPQDIARAQQTAALERLTEISKFGQAQGNASQSYCVQLLGSAFAQTGRVDDAKKQYERFDSFRQVNGEHRVLLLTAIAREQLRQSGNPAGMERPLLEQAHAIAKEMNANLLVTWRAVAETATLWVIAGENDQAEQLAENVKANPGEQQLWLRFTTAWRRGTFDYVTADNTVSSPQDPFWSAVTVAAVDRGYPETALAWALRNSDPAARSESLANWAAAVVRRQHETGEPVAPGDWESRLPETNPNDRNRVIARVNAAVAVQLARLGLNEEAEKYVKKSTAALEALPEVTPQTEMPGVQAVYDFDRNRTQQQPLEMQAAATAELAFADQLLGRPDVAWTRWQQAVTVLDAIAPPAETVQLAINSVNRNEQFFLREIQDVLKLKSLDEARRAERRYLSHAAQMRDMATSASQSQAVLLRFAAENGAGKFVAEKLANPEGVWERLLTTELPRQVLDTPTLADQSELTAKLEDTLKDRGIRETPAAGFQRLFREHWKSGNFGLAAKMMNDRNLPVSEELRTRGIIAAVIQLVQQKEVAKAISLAGQLSDRILAETVTDYFFAKAAAGDNAAKVWAWLQDQKNLKPTLEAAAYHGFLSGLTLTDATKPAAEVTGEPDTSAGSPN